MRLSKSSPAMIRLALGCVLVLLIVSACTSAEDSATTTSSGPSDTTVGPTDTTAPTETTVDGSGPEGELNIAVPDLREETFLPWTGSQSRNVYTGPMFEYLIGWDHINEELQPQLAESWEVSDDALTVTINLQQGIPWHDGHGEMTADDVAYTFERAMEEESINQTASYFRDVIGEIEVVDDYTLIFHLSQPDGEFVANLSAAKATYIVPMEYVEEVGDAGFEAAPIGSGPYQFVEHLPGQSVTYSALEDHWRVEPEFETINQIAVAEESTRFSMLQTGQLDITPLTAENAQSVAEIEGLSLGMIPNLYFTGYLFGGMVYPEDERFVEGESLSDPWADVRVREAMSLAIDRDTIVEQLYGDTAIPTELLYAGPGRENLALTGYDPERARELLAEAGYPDGFSARMISYSLSPGIELPVLAEIGAQYFEAIGIDMEIVPVEFSNYRQNVNEGKTNGDIQAHRTGNPVTPASTMRFFVLPGETLPWFGVGAPEILDTFNSITVESDPDERARLWQQFNDIAAREYASIGIASVSAVYGLSDKVAHWDLVERMSELGMAPL